MNGFDALGRHRRQPRAVRVCLHCGKVFTVPANYLRRGLGKTCGLSCAGKRGGTQNGRNWRAKAPGRVSLPVFYEGRPVCGVRLTRGREAFVDAADADRVAGYNWTFVNGYAVCTSFELKFLHRLICPEVPDGLEVDHRNGFKSDNRRQNLRLCSHAENCQNRGAGRNSRTGVRGVYARPSRRGVPVFHAQVRVEGRAVQVGSFPTLEAAAVAVREARRRLMTHASECEVPA